MIEIKFRVWENKISKMNDLNSCWLEFCKYGETCLVNSGAVGYERISTTDIEIMQFTGLFDKNGKEIYEGDLMAFDIRAKTHYEVKWIKNKFVLHSNVADFDSFAYFEEREVIGNIHENKDML